MGGNFAGLKDSNKAEEIAKMALQAKLSRIMRNVLRIFRKEGLSMNESSVILKSIEEKVNIDMNKKQLSDIIDFESIDKLERTDDTGK